MTYHLDWTVFLFAHTISEVLDLLAFVLVFVAATAASVAPQRSAGRDDRSRHRRPAGARPPRSSPPGCSPRRLRSRRRPTPAGRDDDVDLPQVLQVRAAAITVTAGTTVTWTNDDNFTHSVRMVDDGGDRSMVMKPGESVSFTFHARGRAPLRLLVPPPGNERRRSSSAAAEFTVQAAPGKACLQGPLVPVVSPDLADAAVLHARMKSTKIIGDRPVAGAAGRSRGSRQPRVAGGCRRPRGCSPRDGCPRRGSPAPGRRPRDRRPSRQSRVVPAGTGDARAT